MISARNSVRYVLVAMLIGAVAACASNPDQQAGAGKGAMQDDPSKGIICTYEIPTGSSLRERKCTTPEQREKQRQEAEHQIVIEPGRAR